MLYLPIGMKSETAAAQPGRPRAFDLFWTEVDSPKNHQGAKRVDLQLKRSPNSARRELAALPILFQVLK
jgi:hypothetical protein